MTAELPRKEASPLEFILCNNLKDEYNPYLISPICLLDFETNRAFESDDFIDGDVQDHIINAFYGDIEENKDFLKRFVIFNTKIYCNLYDLFLFLSKNEKAHIEWFIQPMNSLTIHFKNDVPKKHRLFYQSEAQVFEQ